MKKVAVVGSVNVDISLYVDDFPLSGETITASEYEIDVGGKGFNQAIAIKKAGGEVSFLSAIGNDENAKKVQDVSKKYGLDSHFRQSKKVTGTAYIVNKDSNNKIVIVPGSNDDVLISHAEEKILESSDIIVLQNEIPMQTNEFIFSKYKNKIIVYNPSPLKILRDEFYSSISYFIVNETELKFFGSGTDEVLLAKDIVRKGVKNVIVTLGEKGSFLVNNDELIKVDAVKCNAIDTVAAGDTYLGYFVSSIAKDYSLKEAMRLASKASSITVSRKGAIKAIPYFKEVE